MKTASLAICLLGMLSCAACRQAMGATAQSRACVEIVRPAGIGASSAVESYGVRMSATAPETISSPGTVAKFEIISGNGSSCSIIIPAELTLMDKSGRGVARCRLFSVTGRSNPDSPVVGVVIKAEIETTQPETATCPVGFDVIVAYD